MEKEKIIQEISRNLEALKMYADRLEKNAGKAHRIDIELMIEKTREIYDKLIQIDALIIPFETEIPEEVVPEPEKMKEEEIPEPQPEIVAEPPKQEISEPETEEKVEEKAVQEEEHEAVPEPPVREEPVKEEQPVSKEEPEVAPEPEPESRTEQHDEESPKSTIDLFSTAEPTVSDVYSEQETVTVADKFSHGNVNELREAIGINEKFLFINELFNGDMSKYNKVIDELDELTTFKGAETYLVELKVQYQWTEDNPAYRKLTELLKLKFGV